MCADVSDRSHERTDMIYQSAESTAIIGRDLATDIPAFQTGNCVSRVVKYLTANSRAPSGAPPVSRSTHATMPLAEKAYDKLRNMILSGELPPESAITENLIVDRLEIGKTPVREAMRRLVLEGLLDVTPRLGYTVTPVTRDDIDNLFQLRAILEAAAAEMAIDRLDDAEIDRLEVLSETGYDPDDEESMNAYVAANAEFHDIIARGSGNRRLVDLITQLMTESRRFIHMAILSGEHGEEVRGQHARIADAFRRRDRATVVEAMRSHVEDGRAVVLDGLAVGRPGA